MKKLAIIIALLSLTAASFGQGYLSFYNTTGSRISTNGLAFGGSIGLTGTAPNSYYFALLEAPTNQLTITTGQDPTLDGWTFTGNIGTNLTVAGRMFGNGGPGAIDTSSVAISGYSPGDALNFAVVGWSANLGSTWSQVEQQVYQQQYPYDTDPFYGISGNDGNFGYFGVSTVATDIILAPAGGPYEFVFGPAVDGQIQGLTLLTYIPEPGTLALCSLAASTLLFFRRRN